MNTSRPKSLQLRLVESVVGFKHVCGLFVIFLSCTCHVLLPVVVVFLLLLVLLLLLLVLLLLLHFLAFLLLMKQFPSDATLGLGQEREGKGGRGREREDGGGKGRERGS
jgi:hypothetical protein